MSKRIWIVAAGGFGREVFCWLNDILASPNTKQFKIMGFLDDTLVGHDGGLAPLGDAAAGLEVRSIRDYRPSKDEELVCGLGMPRAKANVIPRLLDVGSIFMTLVHPTACIGFNTVIGMGSVICPYTVVSTNVILGDFVMVNTGGTYVAHDARVGEYSTVSPLASILGYACVGKRVLLAAGSCILPSAVVEDDAIIGAGAIVHKKAEAGATYIGNPAHILKKNS